MDDVLHSTTPGQTILAVQPNALIAALSGHTGNVSCVSVKYDLYMCVRVPSGGYGAVGVVSCSAIDRNIPYITPMDTSAHSRVHEQYNCTCMFPCRSGSGVSGPLSIMEWPRPGTRLHAFRQFHILCNIVQVHTYTTVLCWRTYYVRAPPKLITKLVLPAGWTEGFSITVRVSTSLGVFPAIVLSLGTTSDCLRDTE